MPEMDWTAPEKPAQYCERRLIDAILDGAFPVNSNLPAERDLAARLGVTRPTLREVLQRLARDGWLEIHHGRLTRVRDYWREGNLVVLAAIAQHSVQLPADFATNMLAVRYLLAPAYTRLAVERDPRQVVAALQPCLALDDDAIAFTETDWQLQLDLTQLSGNPVFTLIYNSFSNLYRTLGEVYFGVSENRELSRSFYRDLLTCAQKGDADSASALVAKIMQASRERWMQIKT
ncbi:transcriptional regulator [Longilinea arvoryzae]|uniref:Transcriptional regulator n=1 Tax=Longilinea arvoryzae TaxID=360412 RepID=A0A0S7BH48_9CHLR|nr:fatty acid metabolism transcriptional regulator FadR [Longilinea arvoryzae]GAP13378.1 transcriptional regulator [Longilinea arvoryzae]